MKKEEKKDFRCYNCNRLLAKYNGTGYEIISSNRQKISIVKEGIFSISCKCGVITTLSGSLTIIRKGS